MLNSLLRYALAALVLAAGAALLPVPAADAAKPMPPSSLEIPFDVPPAAARISSQGRVELVSGRALDLYNVDFAVNHSTPEDMARQFLRAAADVLRLSDPNGSDLVMHMTRTGPSGTVVRFRQTVDGIPVYGPDLAVKINNDDRVSYVANGYRAGLAVADSRPTLSADQAFDAAVRYISPVGGLGFESNQLVVFPSATGRLAYQVRLEPRLSPLGSWVVMVDAHSGEIFGAKNDAHNVDAPATVFDPDPLGSAGVQYGDPGYVDGGDADTPELTAEALARTLLEVTEVTDGATMYHLTGPWAECVDFESPFDGCYEQSVAAWNFTRNAQAFEQANVYYHIDTYMRYLNNDLSLNIRPDLYPGGVQYDGLGLGGADNSHYLPGSQRVSFGEGGVDDAEDADVVIHELGHGLHDWAAGTISQVQGLSEGIGDFIAGEYSRNFGQWGPGDPEHQWVFSWDGHNPFWPGRVTNWNDTRTYPGDLVGQIHTDGQFWSSCNLDIYDAIGRDQVNVAHWEGIKMTNGGSTQEAAAQAVLQAAVDLAYPQGEIDSILAVYSGCGYGVVGPPIFADGFESGDVLAWSSAQP